MVAVPAETPVTNPLAVPVDTTDAFDVLLQVPPGVKSLTLTDEPTHTDEAPPMPEGFVFIVTTTVAGMPETV